LSQKNGGKESVKGGLRGLIQTSTGISRMLLHSRHFRRQLMFYCSVFVLCQLFVGVFFTDTMIRVSPWFFLVFWIISLGVVLFLFMLATYDLLAVKKEMQQEFGRLRQNLERQISEKAAEIKSETDDE